MTSAAIVTPSLSFASVRISLEQMSLVLYKFSMLTDLVAKYWSRGGFEIVASL